MTLRILAAAFCIFLSSLTANAADLHGVTYSIEPIVGYEFQKKENPTRTRAEFMYGARLIAGYKILSLEGEYTQGKSSEDMLVPIEHIEEKTEKIRAGLRSTFSLGSILDWFLRGGAEAQKIHTSRTTTSGTTESDSPSNVYPYIGTGFSVALGSQFSLNCGVVATLKDLNDLKQTEFTTTLGVKVALNKTR